MKNKLMVLALILSLTVPLYSQVTVDLTIENQNAVGTDFFFDIYLTRTGSNNLYLGNADFVLTFANSNFTSPAGSKVGASPGQCSFVPTDPSGFNTLFTQDAYYTNTSIDIDGQEILINLNGPTPSDQTTFDTRVAEIDNSTSTHCLGQFKISGITNPSGTMDLSWKTAGGGVVTRVFTLGTSTPWTSTQATINANDPTSEPLPVELTSFRGYSEESYVQLNWSTATELNNYGFDLERKVNDENSEWEKIGFVEGAGESNSPNEYSYRDKEAFGASKFIYRLKQLDTDGGFTYSDEIEVEVVPKEYNLYQNYPNPFNPETTIRFSLVEPQKVSIKLYNVVGQEVTDIVNKDYELGYHEINFDAKYLSSGVYFYRLQAGDFVATKKMLLLK